MTRVLRVVAVVAAFLGASAAAGAAPILEVEGNNTLPTAQNISSNQFTLPVPANVFDVGYPTATISGSIANASDVDFFRFTANMGDVYFDIDNPTGSVDTRLSLFNSSGTLVAFDDLSFPADLGSASFDDAFLGVFPITSPGIYYIAVSAFANNPNSLVAAVQMGTLGRPVDQQFGGVKVAAAPGDSSFAGGGVAPFGDYTLHISLQSPATQTTVPEPATMLLFGAGLSALGARLRRRR